MKRFQFKLKAKKGLGFELKELMYVVFLIAISTWYLNNQWVVKMVFEVQVSRIPSETGPLVSWVHCQIIEPIRLQGPYSHLIVEHDRKKKNKLTVIETDLPFAENHSTADQENFSFDFEYRTTLVRKRSADEFARELIDHLLFNDPSKVVRFR